MTMERATLREWKSLYWSEIQLERNNRTQIAGTGVEAAPRADPQPVPEAKVEAARGQAFIGLPKDKFEPRQAPRTSRRSPKTGLPVVRRQAVPRHRGNVRRGLAGDGWPHRRECCKHQAGQGRAETDEKESTDTGLHPGNMAPASLPRRERYL